MRRVSPRFLIATMLAAALAFSPLAAGAQTIAPLVVGTDPQGDWGGGGDAALVGHAAAQDLTAASIGMPNADTVDFVIEMSYLPSLGGIPEGSRYTWNFNVASLDPADPTTYGPANPVEIDGKFTNYSRGACDPTSGQCPPPRDPGLQPFSVRGDCQTNEANVTTCREIAKVQGVFSPVQRTITVSLPSDLIGLGPCTIIGAGTNLFGGSVSAAPSAFFTSSAMPLDTLDVLDRFIVPAAAGEECPAPPRYI